MCVLDQDSSTETSEFANHLIQISIMRVGGPALTWIARSGPMAAVRCYSGREVVGALAPPGRSDASVFKEQRIAVLPLGNTSPDPRDAYFADGMTEELIFTMSKTGLIRVIAHTSVVKYKESGKRIVDIADELDVAAVLEGSVRIAGDALRITLQLVDGATEECLWSQAYDRRLEDVFALQEEVAEQVTTVLQGELLPERRFPRRSQPTRDMDAYMLYMRGRHFWNQRSREAIERSIVLFSQAIQRDPAYASAYAGLADAYAVMANRGYGSRKEAIANAREAAERAIERDPSLGEPHASRAVMLMEDYAYLEAETELRLAIDLAPSYAPAYHWLANLLHITGRTDEALEQVRRALALDPLSAIIGTVAGNLLYSAGQYEEAVGQWRETLELSPGFMPARIVLAHAFQAEGAWKEAWEQLEAAQSEQPDNVEVEAERGLHLLCHGQREAALEALRRAADDPNTLFWSTYLGLGLLLAGAEDEARGLLEAACTEDLYFCDVRITLALADAMHSAPQEALAHLALLDRRHGWLCPALAREIRGFRALVYAMAGDAPAAHEVLDALVPHGTEGAQTVIAVARLWLDELDEGYRGLGEAVRSRDYLVRLIGVWPLPHGVRDDARFVEILRLLGLPTTLAG